MQTVLLTRSHTVERQPTSLQSAVGIRLCHSSVTKSTHQKHHTLAGKIQTRSTKHHRCTVCAWPSLSDNSSSSSSSSSKPWKTDLCVLPQLLISPFGKAQSESHGLMNHVMHNTSVCACAEAAALDHISLTRFDRDRSTQAKRSDTACSDGSCAPQRKALSQSLGFEHRQHSSIQQSSTNSIDNPILGVHSPTLEAAQMCGKIIRPKQAKKT